MIAPGAPALRLTCTAALPAVCTAARPLIRHALQRERTTLAGNTPTMPSTTLHVPIRNAAGVWSVRMWPADLRDLAEKLLAEEIELKPFLSDTEV